MRPKSLGERRTDAPDAVERLQRTEGTVLFAVLDDSRGQRRSDAGEAVEFSRARKVDVHRTGADRVWRRCRRRCSLCGRGAGTSFSSTRSDRRVDL